jgi:hypothetical protein
MLCSIGNNVLLFYHSLFSLVSAFFLFSTHKLLTYQLKITKDRFDTVCYISGCCHVDMFRNHHIQDIRREQKIEHARQLQRANLTQTTEQEQANHLFATYNQLFVSLFGFATRRFQRDESNKRGNRSSHHYLLLVLFKSCVSLAYFPYIYLFLEVNFFHHLIDLKA